MDAKDFLRAYQMAAIGNCFIGEDVDLLSHAALGLTGEAGEVADIIKKAQYSPPRHIDVPHLMEELGDTLFYMSVIAGRYGFDLLEIAKMNAEKLAVRHPSGPFAELVGEQTALELLVADEEVW